jgi:hypothetical protein
MLVSHRVKGGGPVALNVGSSVLLFAALAGFGWLLLWLAFCCFEPFDVLTVRALSFEFGCFELCVL